MPGPFDTISPYGSELSDIQRRKALADILRGQAMEPIPQQTAGGMVIRTSPYQGLAKLANALVAGQAEKEADQSYKNLYKEQQAGLSDTMQRVSRAVSGTPAIAPSTPVDDEGNAVPGVAAQSPDMMRAANIAMERPETQSFGVSMMAQALAEARRKQVMGELGIGSPAASPQQALSAEAAAGGRPGPTQAAAGRVGAPNAGLMGVNPQAAGMILSGDPALTELGKVTQGAYAEQLKPQNVRPGGSVAAFNPATQQYERQFYQPQVGPGMTLDQGGNVSMAQGYGPAQTALHSLPNPSAPMVKLPLSGGQIAELTQPEYLSWQQNGQLPARFGGGASLPGQPGAGQPGTRQPGRPGRDSQGLGVPGLTQSQPDTISQKSQEAYATDRARGFAKTAQDLSDQWNSASKKDMMLDRLEILFQDPNVAAGALAENISDIKGIAASLNINIAGKSSEDAIRAITNEFALELRNPAGGAGMPGAMSDQDRKFLSQIPPGISQSRNGRQIVMMGMRAVNARNKAVSDAALQYEQQRGQLDSGFYRDLRAWSNANPMFSPEQTAAMQELMKRSR
jgi:hypothetical protein